MFKFNQQTSQVKIAFILGFSLVLCVTIYATINIVFRKTDTTRCVDAYMEVNENSSKLSAYKECKYLLKR